jgi:hypothetical protein
VLHYPESLLVGAESSSPSCVAPQERRRTELPHAFAAPTSGPFPQEEELAKARVVDSFRVIIADFRTRIFKEPAILTAHARSQTKPRGSIVIPFPETRIESVPNSLGTSIGAPPKL